MSVESNKEMRNTRDNMTRMSMKSQVGSQCEKCDDINEDREELARERFCIRDIISTTVETTLP